MSGGKSYTPNRLIKYRKNMRYSQQYVARKLKLSSSSVLSKWEKGISRPGLEDLLKLSLLYNTLVEELYAEFREALRDELQLHIQQHGQ
ncbi:MAG TPA: helix-turn-helix domain-containing protein [Bacteroidia bacterium]|jgi:transcriptional regulator with XRE-family HTH domain|nr:helix-turn-helix domain-containing protein [Bacteroidia bacterium]